MTFIFCSGQDCMGNDQFHALSSCEYSEAWTKAEAEIAGLLSHIRPSRPSELQRQAIMDYIQTLIYSSFNCPVFPFGSVPLKTYLPDGDMDLTTFGYIPRSNETWANDLRVVLQREEKMREAKFRVKEVEIIHAEVQVVKCLVDNIIVDISFNQLGGLCTLCFLEKVDRLIGKDHLFKRSIILVKAWCYYESRILGAHHGLLSTYALEILVLYIFHVFHASLRGPLEVFYHFLEFFSTFDWDRYCLSFQGPILSSSLPEMAAEQSIINGGGDFLLSQAFLDTCRQDYSVPPGLQNQAKDFRTKHMNIIDPLRTNNNLGRSVSKGNFFRIRNAFVYGAKKLREIFGSPQEELEGKLAAFFLNTKKRATIHGHLTLQPVNEDTDSSLEESSHCPDTPLVPSPEDKVMQPQSMGGPMKLETLLGVPDMVANHERNVPIQIGKLKPGFPRNGKPNWNGSPKSSFVDMAPHSRESSESAKDLASDGHHSRRLTRVLLESGSSGDEASCCSEENCRKEEKTERTLHIDQQKTSSMICFPSLSDGKNGNDRLRTRPLEGDTELLGQEGSPERDSSRVFSKVANFSHQLEAQGEGCLFDASNEGSVSVEQSVEAVSNATRGTPSSPIESRDDGNSLVPADSSSGVDHDSEADILQADSVALLQNLEFARYFQMLQLNSPFYPKQDMAHLKSLQRNSPWEGPGRPTNMRFSTQVPNYGHGNFPRPTMRNAQSNGFYDTLPTYQRGTGTYLPNPRHNNAYRDRYFRGSGRGQNRATNGEDGVRAYMPKYRSSGRGQNKLELPANKSVSPRPEKHPLEFKFGDGFPPITNANPGEETSNGINRLKSDSNAVDNAFPSNRSNSQLQWPSSPTPVAMVAPFVPAKPLIRPGELEFGSLGPVQFGNAQVENATSSHFLSQQAFENHSNIRKHDEEVLQKSPSRDLPKRASYELKEDEFPPLTLAGRQGKSRT